MGTSNPSFQQMEKIFSLLTDHNIDSEKCQRRIIESGLLADLAWAIGTDRLPDRFAFRKVLGLEPTAADFKIWRTVTLGSKKYIEAYRKAMEYAKFDLRFCKDKIFCAVAQSASTYTSELDLVCVTLSDLGIWKGHYYDICERAQAIGLKFCPAEVGILLRLQYINQPIGEMLHLGMEPFEENGSIPQKRDHFNRYHFVVGREDDNFDNDTNGYLSTDEIRDYAGPIWKFIFVRPRK